MRKQVVALATFSAIMMNIEAKKLKDDTEYDFIKNFQIQKAAEETALIGTFADGTEVILRIPKKENTDEEKNQSYVN